MLIALRSQLRSSCLNSRFMTLSAAELEQRIQQARQGDQQALGSLLELYRAYLGLLVSPQITQLYQAKFSKSDVVQNTFLQAREAFGDFRGATEAELITWLRKILVTQLVSGKATFRSSATMTFFSSSIVRCK